MTRVLFLWPARRRQERRGGVLHPAATRPGTEATAALACTDPDAEVMPNVRAVLEAQGFGIVDNPRLVSPTDEPVADVVVSVGCDHDRISTDENVEWEVTMLSEDFEESMNAT